MLFVYLFVYFQSDRLFCDIEGSLVLIILDR